jgi:excisionase family DNA binding protein
MEVQIMPTTEATDVAPWALLTPKQAAPRLGISQRKLWGLTKSGDITAVKIGSAVRYEPSALADFVARCRVGK